MKATLPTLYYIHDPMCSWCWGFRNVWKKLQTELTGKVNIEYILGGLAPDNNQVMPIEMQQTIENTWRRIQHEIPGTHFNFDFWKLNEPKRSTYPACRAIVAARKQQPELAHKMLLAIQQAYYLQAKNPSDIDILICLAGDIGLNTTVFTADITSELCMNDLLKEITFSRNIDVHSFPSLVLKQEKSHLLLELDYNNFRNILDQIIKFKSLASFHV